MSRTSCLSGSSVQDGPSTDIRSLVERFPHLDRIPMLWGTRECRSYLNHLLTDTRGGQRRGFPPEHAKTIFALLTEHDDSFPEAGDPAEYMGFAALEGRRAAAVF